MGSLLSACRYHVGSGLVVCFIEIGYVSGLNSFLALVVDLEGLGEGEEDILNLQGKSSGSASGVGQGIMTYCCL